MVDEHWCERVGVGDSLLRGGIWSQTALTAVIAVGCGSGVNGVTNGYRYYCGGYEK
jgi:hypothetical protein